MVDLSTVAQVGINLGTEEHDVLALCASLRTLNSVMSGPEDIPFFLPDVASCERYAKNHKLSSPCATLLWAVVEPSSRLAESTAEFQVMQSLSSRPSRQVQDDFAPIVFSSALSSENASEALETSSVSPNAAPMSAIKRLRADLKRSQKLALSVKVADLPAKQAQQKAEMHKAEALDNKVIASCLSILKDLGPISKTFNHYFGDGTRSPSEKETQALYRRFYQTHGCSVKTAHVATCVKDFRAFQSHLEALGASFASLTPFVVSSFLTDSVVRGPSVPARLYSSLRWAESVFEIDCLCSDDFVELEGRGPKDRPPPKQARCPSEGLIKQVEHSVLDQSLSPIHRIIGVVILFLAHGVLRWKDLQSSKGIRKMKHAFIGRSYMKKQGNRSWICLLVGFSCNEWGEEAWALLRTYGFPTASYFLAQFNKNYTGFLERAASYSNVLNAVRFYLVKVLYLTIEDACTYTLHSFRHLYPTMARQMILSNEEQTEIGHWTKPKCLSSMPDHYDAISSSVEITAKNKIVWAFQHGRRICGPGEIPVPLEGKYVGCSFQSAFSSGLSVSQSQSDDPLLDAYKAAQALDDDVLKATPKKKAKSSGPPIDPQAGSSSGSPGQSTNVQAPAQVLVPIEPPPDSTSVLQTPLVCKAQKRPVVPLPPDQKQAQSKTVQVVHVLYDKVHLYNEVIGKPGYPICNSWNCGVPEAPSLNAAFHPTDSCIEVRINPYQACGTCYSEEKLAKLPDRSNLQLSRNQMLCVVEGRPAHYSDDSEHMSDVPATSDDDA